MNWTVELIFTLNNSHLYVKIRVSTKHFQQLWIHDDTTYCISKVFSSLREIENVQIKKTVGTSHGITKKKLYQNDVLPHGGAWMVLQKSSIFIQCLGNSTNTKSRNFKLVLILMWSSKENFLYTHQLYKKDDIKDRFFWIVIKT